MPCKRKCEQHRVMYVTIIIHCVKYSGHTTKESYFYMYIAVQRKNVLEKQAWIWIHILGFSFQFFQTEKLWFLIRFNKNPIPIIPLSGVLVGCGKKKVTSRDFQRQICGEKGQFCRKFAEFFRGGGEILLQMIGKKWPIPGYFLCKLCWKAIDSELVWPTFELKKMPILPFFQKMMSVSLCNNNSTTDFL